VSKKKTYIDLTSNQFGHGEIDLFNMTSEINNCHNLMFFFSPKFFNKKTMICSSRISKCHHLDLFIDFLVKENHDL
jgi:hypothetical protein